MSMFGAVDLSSLVPPSGAGSSGAAGSGRAAPGASGGRGGASPVPGGPAGPARSEGSLAAPLVVSVDAARLREVVELSTRVPVVVVLHSPRSQVSSELAETLGRLAEGYAGRFQLAQVDVDAVPEVAQAFQVQAVPTVLALLGGQPVPMFQGTATEEQLRGVLDQVLEVAAANGITGTITPETGPVEAPAEPEETEVERAAREAIEAGDLAAAEEIYTHAINQNPADDRLKAARNQVRLMARLEGADPQALLAKADAAPQDLDAALAGADAALALGDVNAALGRVLEAVRSHTGEEREKARLRALELFEVIGATTPEVARARRMLASILY